MDIKDVKGLYANAKTRLLNLGYTERKLGEVSATSVSVFIPPNYTPAKKSILIMGGFSGSDQCGSWAIVNYINSKLALVRNKINVSFIVCVAPSKFRLGNRGVGSISSYEILPTMGEFPAETNIFFRNFSLLRKLSHNGFLTLHEDWRLDKFIIFAYHAQNYVQKLPLIIRMGVKQFFPPFTDTKYLRYKLRDGIVQNDMNKSLERRFFKMASSIINGISVVIPYKRAVPFKIRAFTIAIIYFVKFFTG